MKRYCSNCVHIVGSECRHPQAKDQWGTHANMSKYLPDDRAVWPKAYKDHACGWWRPTTPN